MMIGNLYVLFNQNYNNPKKGFFKSLETIEKNRFKKEFHELIEYSNKTVFKINPNFTEQDIIDIYE